MAVAFGIVKRVATPQNAKVSAARRRRPQPSVGRPFLITMLVAAAGASSWLAYGYYCDNHVTLMFANGEHPVPPLELTFYPEQLAFTSPSPPSAIGEHRIEDQASVVVGDEFVPGHGVVRYRGEGVGTGFAYVKLGQKSTIQLRAPQSLRGRVGEPIGYWFMGWRCAGVRPVANAEVVIMGGGVRFSGHRLASIMMIGTTPMAYIAVPSGSPWVVPSFEASSWLPVKSLAGALYVLMRYRANRGARNCTFQRVARLLRRLNFF